MAEELMTGKETSDGIDEPPGEPESIKEAPETAESSTEIFAKRVTELEEELRESERRMRAIVDAAPDAIITIDEEGAIREFNGTAEKMFGYTAEEIIGKSIALLMPDPYAGEHCEYLRRYLETGEPRIIGKTRELRARRKNGRTFPIALSVSAVDHLGCFTGIVRDISAGVALQRRIIEIAAQERRRIGEELHDGLQQELTGLGLLAQNLADALREIASDQAESAAKVAKGISLANEHARSLARGLLPLAVKAEGLMSALSALAEETEATSGLSCTFEAPEAVLIADDVEAMQLYRIAQEAVTNALKHAEASQIAIRLTRTDHAIRLEVDDDGIGIDDKPEQGNGLRIMRHRCEVIGGDLRIGKSTTGGTALVCIVPLQ